MTGRIPELAAAVAVASEVVAVAVEAVVVVLSSMAVHRCCLYQ